MVLEVYKQDGTLSGKKVKLSKEIFGIEPNNHAMYLAVRMQMTNSRQGTAAAKNRSAVRGGGRKPWRQKGRGTARAGTTRSPLWAGGGKVFAPSPHDYQFKLPKKVKRLARLSALSTKAQDKTIKFIENFSIDNGKTKDMYGILRAMELDSEKVLLIIPENDSMVLRACHNIPNLQVRIADTASTVDILNCRTLLIQESALKKLEGTLVS